MMMKYSEQDAARLIELQEITEKFRKSLMCAIASKRMSVANKYTPETLKQLDDKAYKAQCEIDDIVRKNFCRNTPASLISSVCEDNGNKWCGHQAFNKNQCFGGIRAYDTDPQGSKCDHNERSSDERSGNHSSFHG